MVMIVVNIHEAKAKLSEYLDAVAKGEHVVICKRNQPVADLRAVAQKRTEPRPMGLAKGQITIPPSFFDPMPEAWLDEFDRGPIFPTVSTPAARRPSRVAERPATHGSPAKRRPRR